MKWKIGSLFLLLFTGQLILIIVFSNREINYNSNIKLSLSEQKLINHLIILTNACSTLLFFLSFCFSVLINVISDGCFITFLGSFTITFIGLSVLSIYGFICACSYSRRGCFFISSPLYIITLFYFFIISLLIIFLALFVIISMILRSINNDITENELTTIEFQTIHYNHRRSSMPREVIIHIQPESMNSCLICNNIIKDDDHIVKLECNHIFHNKCVSNWIKRKHTCPIC